MIYIIEAEFESKRMFKIGFTRGDPVERLKQLQVTSPVRLKLVKRFEGGLADEKRLHDYLWCLRLHGEWFKHGPLMDDFLKKADGSTVFRN